MRAGLIVISVVIALAIGELLLRTVDPPFFSSRVWEYEETLGWKNRPNEIVFLMFDRPVRVEFNAEGFRDLPRDTAKPNFVKRIAIIGDSNSQASQVNLHQTWWSLLGQSLNAGSRKVYWEVMNFGVGDWGMTQAYLALIHYGLKYQPDIVILQITSWNDICNNSLDAAYICSMQDTYRPYLNPADGFKSVTYVSPTASWLRRNSRLFRFADALVRKHLGDYGSEITFSNRKTRKRMAAEKVATYGLPAELHSNGVGFNSMAPEADQVALIRTGWRATERLIELTETAVNERGIRLIVVVFPKISLLRPSAEPILANLPFSVDLHYPEKHISSVLNGADFVPLIDALRANRAALMPQKGGHLNPVAHRTVAKLLKECVLGLSAQCR